MKTKQKYLNFKKKKNILKLKLDDINLKGQKHLDIYEEITRFIKEAKEIWMVDRCEELEEELQIKNDVFNMHKDTESQRRS